MAKIQIKTETSVAFEKYFWDKHDNICMPYYITHFATLAVSFTLKYRFLPSSFGI